MLRSVLALYGNFGFGLMQMNIAKALAAEFSFIRAKLRCECGSGWHELLRDMCKEIEEAYKEKNLAPDIEIYQISEKYGTLCVDYWPSTNIDKIIEKYEELSEFTCEKCGQPGIMREKKYKFGESWFSVRSDDCFDTERKYLINRTKKLLKTCRTTSK